MSFYHGFIVVGFSVYMVHVINDGFMVVSSGLMLFSGFPLWFGAL